MANLVSRINKSFFKVTMNQADALVGTFMMTASPVLCYSLATGDKFYLAIGKTVIAPSIVYTIFKGTELFGTQKFYNKKQKNKL